MRDYKTVAVPLGVAVLAIILVVGGQLGLSGKHLQAGVESVIPRIPDVVWPLAAAAAWLLWFRHRFRRLLWMALAATGPVVIRLDRLTGILPPPAWPVLFALQLAAMGMAILVMSNVEGALRRIALTLMAAAAIAYLLPYAAPSVTVPDLFGLLIMLLLLAAWGTLAVLAFRGSGPSSLRWLGGFAGAQTLAILHSLAVQAGMKSPLISWAVFVLVTPLPSLLFAGAIWAEARSADRGM